MKKREKIYIFGTKILTGGLFHGKNEFDLVFENMMYFFKKREFVDDTIKMEYYELGIS